MNMPNMHILLLSSWPNGFIDSDEYCLSLGEGSFSYEHEKC